MTGTSERRLAIRDFISERRRTTVPEIMEEFHVGYNTVLRDLDAITEITSFYKVPGRGGGIHAVDGWYIAHLLGEQVAPVQQPIDQLRALMEKSGVTEQELQKVVSDSVKMLVSHPADELWHQLIQRNGVPTEIPQHNIFRIVHRKLQRLIYLQESVDAACRINFKVHIQYPSFSWRQRKFTTRNR